MISLLTLWWQHHSVALSGCVTHAVAPPKNIPWQLQTKREKLIEEAVHFQVTSKLKQLFFSQICQENVAMNKEFNLKRNYQTKHANAYDKPLGSCCLFQRVNLSKTVS